MEEMKKSQIGNLQDCWSLLYITLAREFADSVPVEGEAAIREAVRQFGKDRGEKLKKRHIEQGLKINLENLFTYYDLPGDPRFKRRKIRLNSQERLSDTLVCPIAQLWKDLNEKALGRIYCEEFHHAMFGSYANKAQIDLSKTLTQEGDEYCCFAVYLRPANMDKEERKEAFSEFDDSYRFPENLNYDEGTHRDGFNMLCIKLGYYMIKQGLELLGEQGRIAAVKGLRSFAVAYAEFLFQKSKEMGVDFDRQFVAENSPFSLNMDEDLLWKEYCAPQVTDLFGQEFYTPFHHVVKSFVFF